MGNEEAINNSYEILNMFEKRDDKIRLYHTDNIFRCWYPTYHNNRPGKCKVFTKKEIDEYVSRSFQNKTVFEGR